MISHWLGAHHRRSRMLRGRWPLSCDYLDMAGPSTGVKHTHLGLNIQEKGENLHILTQTQTHIDSNTCTYTLDIQHTFVCIDSLMVMMVMMVLMLVEPQLQSVDLCQVSAFPSLLLNPYGALPPLSSSLSLSVSY